MQTIGVYLNGRASGSGGKNYQDSLNRALFRSELLYRSPRGIDQLHTDLQSDLEAQVDGIFCIGGDGTVNAVIQSLAHQETGLLVIPAGTANDLASELGNKRSIKKLIESFNNDQSKQIDLISVNGRYMATNGGFGIGSEVARKINEARAKIPLFKTLMRFSGKKIYSLFIPSELMSLKFDRYPLMIESSVFNGPVDACALLVNNQPTLAGTFTIAPHTRNDDGLFNVTILRYSNRRKFVQTLMALAAGYFPVNDPDFISFETDRLNVKLMDPRVKAPFFGDGEIFENTDNSWDFKIAPKALKVYSPGAGEGLVHSSYEVSLA
jgi:diacylglycerol kinase family enzyme